MGQRAIIDDGSEWLGRRSKAIALIACDSMSSEDICKECEISITTLNRWKRHPHFARRIDIARKEIAQRAMTTGVALKTERIRKANKRWDKLHKVIESRAAEASAALADPSRAETVAPGAETGLLAHTRKAVGSGDNQQIDDVWEVDTGLLQEIRAHELQVAKELGQLVERQSITIDRWEDLPPEAQEKLIQDLRAKAFADPEAARAFERQVLIEAGHTIDATCEVQEPTIKDSLSVASPAESADKAE